MSKFKYTGNAPQRLDLVLAELSGDLSRTKLKEIIVSGEVTIDGKVVNKPSSLVSPNSEIILNYVPEPEVSYLKPYELTPKIIFEDEQVIVIDKPAGLSVHPGAGNKDKTLANALVWYLGDKLRSVGDSMRPGIVHRLDKDTSGLIVVAKTQSAHLSLSKQFAEKVAGRVYEALVFSFPKGRDVFRITDSGEIVGSIGRDPNERKRFAVVEGGKVAKTKFTVLERFEYAIRVEFVLETGRTHQIRVHAAWKGAPLISDEVYGKPNKSLPGLLRKAADEFGRQALHAKKLSFIHPVSKKILTFEAPLPKEFITLIDAFRG